MIIAENITMKFDLNRGKVKSLKEKLFSKIDEEEKLFIALENVSFKIEKGEIFGVIGNNGAGKSTLLKILCGIMKPSSGKIYTEGRIAPMIELGTGFDFELSAIENIYLSGAILGYSKKFLDEKISNIIEFSELEDFKDVQVKYFSSGMIARLAFSISTIIKPDILIVDEILSVGDLSFQEKSYRRMMELMSSGTTVVYVSHDIEGLSKLCNKVLWLANGRVKMIGNSDYVCKMFKDNDY